MVKVISTQFQDSTLDRLNRVAEVLGKSPSDTIATLVEESLREIEFSHIEFRNSTVGRQAYLQSSSLTVWEVIKIARSYEMDVAKVAEHFERPMAWVNAAFQYAEAFSEEIDRAISESQTVSVIDLKRMLPQLEVRSTSSTDA